MVLYISFIFFEEILGKFSLIFKISLILGNKACIYNQLSLLLDLLAGFLHLFLKKFNFFKTSMLGIGEMGGRTLDISTFLPVFNVLAFMKE